jgi:hypothetical protein
MATKITDTEIERRFAALDERGAEVDAALERARELIAAMNARLLAHEERTEVPPLPWIKSEDGSEWRAELPDGRTAVIERLDDGDENGDGASFLPKVHESREDFAVGPVFAGVLAAAAWVAEYAGSAGYPKERLADRVAAIENRMTDNAIQLTTKVLNVIWEDAYARGMKRADDLLVDRVASLEAESAAIKAKLGEPIAN